MKKAYRKGPGRSREDRTGRTGWKARKAYRGAPVRLDAEDGLGAWGLQMPLGQRVGDLREQVNAFAGQAGLQLMLCLIAEEVEQVAGRRYARDPDRRATRWGHEEGHVVWSGRKVPIERPRVRSGEGREVPLERYGQFQRDGALQRDVARRVLAGVSTRNYAGVVDALCEGYGISKSAVSRQWKGASARAVQALAERPLGALDLAVLVLDGVHFKEHLFVVALGIDVRGQKHVLGLWQGATENATVCGELLDDLIRRGLRTDRAYLFVLDGSKALAKAVRSRFGPASPIQRCQVHKERNVLDHLPKGRQAWVRRRLRAAWEMQDYGEAKRALEVLVRELTSMNPSAARSLEEGLEETLTVHRLGVPGWLRTTLRSTNVIESCFSLTRQTSRNVKRWRSADQAWRWAGTCLLAAEKRFRRVKGHRALPVLLAALGRAVDAAQAAG